jgi:Fe-S cluster assembly iron-binding protein IscA
MVEVTPAASKAIQGFMKEKDLNQPLRVFLQSGG